MPFFCTLKLIYLGSEFNYVKNANDECVLVPGTVPLPNDDSCRNNEEFWYERTPYRKIPYSSCVDGDRPDRGKAHRCPGFGSKGTLFWMFMIGLPFGFTALVGYYYYRRSGLARGLVNVYFPCLPHLTLEYHDSTIRLPSDARSPYGESGIMATLASVPWFVIGISGIAYEWVASRMDTYLFRPRRGYRNVPIDEDAQILRFEDEE